MKHNKPRYLAAALSLATLLAAAPAGAAQEKQQSQPLAQNQQVSSSLTQEAGKKAQEKREEIIQEAVSALQESFAALKALDQGDKKKALDALSKAIGKLEVVVARHPELALAPVDVSMTTFDVIATTGEILRARKEVIALMEKGDLPTARALLDSLRSEIVVTVTSVPLATYPDALKAITPLIDQGKMEEAKMAMESALATLVVTRHIIPLPLLRAEEALVVAEVLAEKKNRSEKENLVLHNTLMEVEVQLKRSEALGYGTHERYQELQKQLDEIRDKVSGGKSGTGFFDKIRASMESLKAEIFGGTEPATPKSQEAKPEKAAQTGDKKQN